MTHSNGQRPILATTAADSSFLTAEVSDQSTAESDQSRKRKTYARSPEAKAKRTTTEAKAKRSADEAKPSPQRNKRLLKKTEAKARKKHKAPVVPS